MTPGERQAASPPANVKETMDAPQQLVMKTQPAPVAAPAPVWLQRMSLAVLVLFCFYIGGLLTFLPWWPRYWDYNGWVVGHAELQALLNHGWVRGLVSGIGLIDIWIGISELLHYRDLRR
jgi:hypothetical protein